MIGRLGARDGDDPGVVVSVTTTIIEISAMPVRPTIHRPVGRREKRERDRDYQRKRDLVASALYRSKRWLTERAAFLDDHPLCAEYDSMA